MKTRAAAELAADARYRAYQRRWRARPTFDDDKTAALCEAYLRRMRALGKPRGDLQELVNWVPRLGHA